MQLNAEDIVYPSGASGKGFFDITKPPYNAPNDGIGDATLAINTAIAENIRTGRSLYFPNGTYLVSNTLEFPKKDNNNPSFLNLQGQSEAGVIIKLKDNCTGFTNIDSPKPIIVTGFDAAQCFMNGINNITINSGNGNSGAIGLRYYSNNTGTASNISITSGDGTGAIGLDFYWGAEDENGPLLVKNCTINGFNVGINVGTCQNSQTLENITLLNQKVIGIKATSGGVISIHNLSTTSSVQAIQNTGTLTLIDANLNGQSASTSAVLNSGTLYIRNFTASGYERGIDNDGGNKTSLSALTSSEWNSHNEISLNAGKSGMLKLPINETPDMIWDDPSDWQLVDCKSGEDATDALQAAIDAGKTTVYFNTGSYIIAGPVYIRGKVRTIYGFGSTLDIWEGGSLITKDGVSPNVLITNFIGGYQKPWFVTHTSSRTLVLKNLLNFNVKKEAGSGDLYIEDVCANPSTFFEFNGGNVWARQLNPENEGTHIVNNGSNLWILGLKAERGGTLIETKNNGKTEVCGFFFYTTTNPVGKPMFINNESKVSIVGAETTYGAAFATFISETIGGVTKSLNSSVLPKGCGGGHVLPYYVSNTGVSSSANSKKIDDNVNIFPNPVNSTLHLQNESLLGIFNCQIFDFLGRPVNYTSRISNISDNQIDIDCATFVNGLYFLKFNKSVYKFAKI